MHDAEDLVQETYLRVARLRPVRGPVLGAHLAGISHVGTFLDVALFAKFELPDNLPADREPAS